MSQISIGHKIKSLFLNNMRVKLLCLVLAIVLWVFVASGQSLLGKFPNQLPVKAANLSTEYTAFLDQDKVQLFAMAEPSVWKSLTTDSFVVSVDLAGMKEGTYEVDIRAVSNVANVQITKVEPSKIFVTIEKIVSKTLPVTARIEGDPVDGMAVGNIEVSPGTTIARGPSGVLNNLNELNVIIKLNGESAEFSRTVKIVALGEDGKELSGLTFDSDQASVKVPIIKGGNNKTVGIKVKTKNSPKEGFYISNVIVTPAVVDIIGARSLVSSIYYLETEEIDLSGISGTVQKGVSLAIPVGINLQKGVNNIFQVTLTVTENSISKQIIPTISPTGLADGLKVSYSPSDLKILVNGPASLINVLDSTGVKLEINLTGRAVGNYNIALTADMVKIVNQLLITSIIPSSLAVSISN